MPNLSRETDLRIGGLLFTIVLSAMFGGLALGAWFLAGLWLVIPVAVIAAPFLIMNLYRIVRLWD